MKNPNLPLRKSILTFVVCFLINFNSLAIENEIDSIFLEVNYFQEENVDELDFEILNAYDDIDFFKKRKFNKKKSRKPSISSVSRLKCQSNKVKKVIKHTNRRNKLNKKQIHKNQLKKKRYCAKKNHFKVKKSRFDKRHRVKKIRRY
ncbi:MAG: hypothetical protein ACK5B9_05815 [Flavobacteriia bacterium]